MPKQSRSQPHYQRWAGAFVGGIAGLICIVTTAAAAPAATGEAPPPPSSAPSSSTGEAALFETPHLRNIAHPETLEYSFERTGPAPLVDRVEMAIDEIHPDGTKYVSFDFLTGANHTFFPAVDHFSGNPMLMVFLEHDVRELKDQTGIAAAHFRDEIRAAFTDHAIVSDSTIAVDGKQVPAREIIVTPFGEDERLTNLPSFQAAQYRFVVADAVPGGISSIAVSMPADARSGAVAWSEKITFKSVKP